MVVALTVSCRPSRPSSPPAPHVRIVVDGEKLDAYRSSAWAPLGFTVSFDDMMIEECPRFWYAMHLINCQITIYLMRDQRLIELAGTEALAERAERVIRIDAAVAGDRLKISVAHELGHILLDTKEHTAGGIMGGATWVMRPVDYELACRTIGICVAPK